MKGIPSTANVIVHVNADVALLLLLLLLLVVQSLTPKSALSVGPSSCAARWRGEEEGQTLYKTY